MNEAQEKLNKWREENKQRKRDRFLSDIRFLLKSPEGRRFFWELLSRTTIFHSSYVGDVNATLFNEGRRSVGLNYLTDLLEAQPAAFLQMQQEYASESKRDESIEKDLIKKVSDSA